MRVNTSRGPVSVRGAGARAWRGAIVLGCCLWAALAFAHGGPYPVPTEDELAQVAPPLRGAPEFAQALALQGRGLLTGELTARVGEANRHYGFAEAIRKGWYGPGKESHAEFNRWKGDVLIEGVARELEANLVFDFRPDGSMPPQGEVTPLEPQNAALLIKSVTGPGPAHFVYQSFGMQQERYAIQYTVPAAPGGTTYALIRLDQVPPGVSSTVLALRKEGEENPFAWHALKLNPPPMGQLKLDLLDGEGQETPALVRLAAMPKGVLWAPPNAVNFHPMLNDVTGPEIKTLPGLYIYGPGRAFMVRIPGPFEGYYWVVPGGFEMPLPPGQWELTVLRGIEHKPVRKTFAIQADEWNHLEIRTERWTDMAARGWYSGDDHVHSRLLNSTDAEKLLAFSQAMDIRVSNILEMGESKRTYYIQRGFGKPFRVEDRGYWLIPGQEDPRSILGHNIGMNTTSMVRDLDKYLLLDWIAHEVHAQGGLFGQTHVGQNVCEAHRGMALLAPRELYDFYSIMQGGLGAELYYDFLDLGYRLSATAGSDMPYGGTVGNVRVYAHTGASEPFTPDAWFDAIKAGKTFVTNGPMVEFSVEGAGPGETIAADGKGPLKVQARAWGLEGESAPVGLEIVGLSEVLAAKTAPPPGAAELSLEAEVDAGDGMWIAARVWGANGSAAHTTPVYVKREGRRHWNLARVEEIVAKQLGVLDEIEGVIQETEARVPLSHFDFDGRRIVAQAEALRERLDISRGIYRELLAEARQQAR